MKLIALTVILSCCLVHVYCDCSASQAATVQQQWAATFNSRERVLEFASACLQRLTEQHPEAVPPGTSEATIERMVGRLSTVIELLDNPTELQTRLAAARESGRFNPQRYQVYLQNVLYVVPGFVGQSYDSAAWQGCFAMLGQLITQS